MSVFHSNESRELSLQEVAVPEVGKTVTIEGRHYTVLGDEAKLHQLHEYLPTRAASAKQFDAVLIKLGMQDFASARARALGDTIIIRSLTEVERLAATEINGLVEKEVKERQFRGAVLVVHDGKPMLMKGYGPASSSGTPITEKTLFHIGSITKQFTAVAIMQLLEQGKIASLDEKISKYLPPKYAENPTWKDITIRQLLTHTSGIPNIPPPDQGVPYKYSPDEVIDLFKNQKLDFEPGTYYNYSNSGYDLLGKIIENVSGQRYEEFLDENIFKPVGMRSTVAGPSPDLEHCAQGFERQFEDGECVVKETDFHASHLNKAYAAGNMLSTIEDLGKWDAALHNNTLLSKKGTEELFRYETKPIFFPIDPDLNVDTLQLPALFCEGDRPITYPNARYGLGWKLFPELPEAGLIQEHGGQIPGFHGYITRYPESKSCIVVLSNIVDHTPRGEGGSEELAHRIEEILLKIPKS